MLYIGIDPGVKNGFAVWSSRDRTLPTSCLKELSFWDLIEELRGYGNPTTAEAFTKPEVTVIIEDPGLNKPVFAKRGADNYGAMQRVAQNVGMNKAYARLIIEYCQKYEIPYQTVKPTTKKWSKEEFRMITRVKEVVSQHTIDAVKLVYGL